MREQDKFHQQKYEQALEYALFLWNHPKESVFSKTEGFKKILDMVNEKLNKKVWKEVEKGIFIEVDQFKLFDYVPDDEMRRRLEEDPTQGYTKL